jgi:hypothetical protein
MMGRATFGGFVSGGAFVRGMQREVAGRHRSGRRGLGGGAAGSGGGAAGTGAAAGYGRRCGGTAARGDRRGGGRVRRAVALRRLRQPSGRGRDAENHLSFPERRVCEHLLRARDLRHHLAIAAGNPAIRYDRSVVRRHERRPAERLSPPPSPGRQTRSPRPRQAAVVVDPGGFIRSSAPATLTVE